MTSKTLLSPIPCYLSDLTSSPPYVPSESFHTLAILSIPLNMPSIPSHLGHDRLFHVPGVYYHRWLTLWSPSYLCSIAKISLRPPLATQYLRKPSLTSFNFIIFDGNFLLLTYWIICYVNCLLSLLPGMFVL